jgi:uncharacterized protein YbaP (TraB family)
LHVGRREWLFPGPQVRQALSDSDVIALELDVLDPDVPRRLMARLAAASPAPPLPRELKGRLAAVAIGQCLSLGELSPLRPELQLVTVTTRAGRLDGLDAAYGIDLMLAGYARGSRKPVASLETPEAQAEALLMPPHELLQMVEQGIVDLESGGARAMVARLADIWSAGRFDELERYAEWCECLASEAARAWHARLLDQRNPGLADGIDRLHRGQGRRVYAAVGSLHLIGQHGLPALLAARGYRVERVAFP